MVAFALSTTRLTTLTNTRFLTTSTTSDPRHVLRLKNWRASLLNRTANRNSSSLQSLLHQFSTQNIPFLTETELSEFDHILRLDDTDLNNLIERPGSPEERHPYLQSNFTLDRFLNFARFKSGAGEYR